MSDSTDKILMIVESDTKAKKIQQLLGGKYIVRATAGHFMEIPPDEKDLLHPKLSMKPLKRKKMNEIKQLMKQVSNVYIASDEDREGEAIAYHLASFLGLPIAKKQRMVFHEITKKALEKSLTELRTIDMGMVESQEARSIGDRLIGFRLSKHLWHIAPKLSAGRVQSVALRLIVEKEDEIRQKPTSTALQFYVLLEKDSQKITAKDMEKYPMEKWNTMETIYKSIQQWEVIQTKRYEQSVKPPPPFTTSSLQQEVLRRYPSMSADQVTKIAQELYETGRTTYPRTDSTSMSQDFKDLANTWILKTFGESYQHSWNHQAASDPNAQEAHECIRTTGLQYFEQDTFRDEIDALPTMTKKVYFMILYRSIGSLMSAQILQKREIIWKALEQVVRLQSKSSEETFDGFMRIWRMHSENEKKQGLEEEAIEEDEEETISSTKDTTFAQPFATWWKSFSSHKNNLSTLVEKDHAQQKIVMAMEEIQGRISRYTEATVVKALEKRGIGRPSTYSNILQTIQKRGYVQRKTVPGTKVMMNYSGFSQEKDTGHMTYAKMIGKEMHRLVSTPLGEQVSHYLEENFPPFVEYGFTAEMEHALDQIANSTTKKMKKDILLGKWDATITEWEEKMKLKTPADTSSTSTTITSTMSTREKNFGMYKERELKASNTKFGVRVQWGDKVFFIKELTWSTDLTMEAVMEHLPIYCGVYEQEDVYVRKGPYGYYIEYGKQKVSLPKEISGKLPQTIEEAIPYIEKKKESSPIKGGEEEMKTWTVGKKCYLSKRGPYGWYIKSGDDFVNIPEEMKEEVWGYEAKELKSWFDLKWKEKKEWLKSKSTGSSSSSSKKKVEEEDEDVDEDEKPKTRKIMTKSRSFGAKK